MRLPFPRFSLSVTVLVMAMGAAGADPLAPGLETAKAVFGDSTGQSRRELELSESEVAALAKTLGWRVDLRRYLYLEVDRQGAPLGIIFILDVLGQSQPITFAVAVGTDGAVKDIEILAYREPRGEEIREARFRRQFSGKELRKDPIALDKDINAISGATISSRSATYAARKALALAEILRSRQTPAAK